MVLNFPVACTCAARQSGCGVKIKHFDWTALPSFPACVLYFGSEPYEAGTRYTIRIDFRTRSCAISRSMPKEIPNCCLHFFVVLFLQIIVKQNCDWLHS